MLSAQAAVTTGLLDPDTVSHTLQRGLAGRFGGQKLLILIPDHTRTLPLPRLFAMLSDILHDAAELTFMVALGTHPPLEAAQLDALVGHDAAARRAAHPRLRLINHAWRDPDALTSLGTLERSQLQEIAGATWHPTLGGDVEVKINREALAADRILVLGPTFPHEVAGFSGGAKYLFPGISGPEMINVSHWLGALSGVRRTIGIAETPVRAMIHAATALVPTPITVIGLTVVGEGLAGVFIGDHLDAWRAAAEHSSKRHIVWVERPFQRVLSWAPPMYDELWTAGKAMYKLEPALAAGGELIIYAPHLSEVSLVHGHHIREIGYHVLPYFLEQWQRFAHLPLGVLAHSTHVRGDGRFENGVELPRARVTLATQLTPAECDELALGYLDPAGIDLDSWRGREDEGVLFVPKAGELLYRVK